MKKDNLQNRIYKFRAWDLEKKKWIKDRGTTFDSPEPKEGSIALSLDGHLRVYYPSCYKPEEDEDGKITEEAVNNQLHAIANSEYESIHPMETNPHYKKQYVLMQYTGLKDKDGKEIFEGDIVEYRELDRQTGKKLRGEIVFRDCRFHIKDRAGIFQYSIEVIGNVYQNPELLK